MKERVERIRSKKSSDVLMQMAKRAAELPAEPVHEPVIGVVKSSKGMKRLQKDVEEVMVKDRVCNSRIVQEWDLSIYSLLKKLTVGKECFQFVKNLVIAGLNELMTVVIGSECFKASGGVFEMRDCEKLESVTIGDGSFVSVKWAVFESECWSQVVMD